MPKAFVLFLALSLYGGMVSAKDRPNILVLLADDLGYGDIGCYGHPTIQTPHLDKLATEGLRLTDCYSAAANCSPARAGLMTGRNPWRVGVHNWIPMMSPMHLKASEITIATLLKNDGYDTAQVGKWHLNGMFNLPGQPQPDDHGFNHWFAVQNNALPNHKNPYNFVRNDIPLGPIEGFSGGIVADETFRWLEEDWDREKPFFAYVCFHEPHEPIATAERFQQLYSDSDDPSLRAHHGNISQLDAAVGKVLKKIDQLGLRENTFVFFTSDNGPAKTRWHPHGSSGPLRDHKGHMYDGGIRVPGIIRWPGVTKPGSLSAEPVIGTDLLPTLCEVVGIEPPEDRAIDGTSLVSFLKGGSLKRERPLYWHFYRASSRTKVALRDRGWKILATLKGPALKPSANITQEEIEAYKTAELGDFELYQIHTDAGERYDLKAEAPAEFARLKKQLEAYYREVRDESPTWPEWEWPRYEGQRIEWPEYGRRK